MKERQVTLTIVVPCYNEQDVLEETAARLSVLSDRLIACRKISPDSKLLFVDDGSQDRSWELIEQLVERTPLAAGVKLSRNFGHQNALLAGLFTASGDAVISIDADLQDDIEKIDAMIDHYLQGSDIVYGVRRQREHDTAFKRGTARIFYRLLTALGANTIPEHADFRLLSRRAIEALKEYREINLFLRGIVPLVGFRSSIVYFERHKRFAGQSKYPLKKMIDFALDAITSFSVVPLRLISVTGLILFLLALAMSAWAIWVVLGTDRAVPGWASTLLPTLFFGGVQILCLGVIGEYIGKVYVEVKSRPRYIIEKVYGLNSLAGNNSDRSRDSVNNGPGNPAALQLPVTPS